ncbi:MAG: hypothetical protein ACK5QH_13115 [Rubrivivax sp.]
MRAMNLRHARTAAALAATLAASLLVGCVKGGDSSDESLTVNGDVAIAYVKRSTTVAINPTDGTSTADGGDLLVRAKSSPSAAEYNITASITQGKGDVSDPEVSYDGKKLVFALRCPTSNTAQIDGAAACTGRWNIWEYDMSASANVSAGKLRRVTASTADDDVDPAYLPSNRGFVFSSNRQTKSKALQVDGRSYYALDEYERERVLNLHTMDSSGGAVTQISFNQSHDRNPVVRPNGDIMFSRWEHMADRNRFAIFRSKPDGTDMFVLYGAQSPGNSFLHPRDMDPTGPYKGFVATSLMALSGTQEGGSLMFIDVANYSEQNTPANATIQAAGGQREATAQALNQNRGLSTYGRITSPYPLWDGSNRVLLAWRPCEVMKDGKVVSCASLSAADMAILQDGTMTREQRAAASVQDTAPAAYAIYMFNPADQTWLVVATPPTGTMYTDPVALQARPEPAAAQPTLVDETLAAQNLGLIEVRSVYDTDGLNRMAEPMLVAADLPAGCAKGIATTAPSDSLDTRAQVADLLKLKNPADPAYGCTPVRFVRATRAVAPPAGSTGMREAIGETDFEQQQILGYAPIEPDGSFKLHIPADTPVALAIIDTEGRAFQTHTNWIQVRPGERRTCDGCHSPRRGASLNSGTVANTLPPALKQALAAQHQSGETLASLRTRLDATALKLVADPVFTDLWADTTRSGVKALPTISVRYTGNTDASQDLVTAAPTRGLINYPEHIAPLWLRQRGTDGVNTCVNCHSAPEKLDLRATLAGTGRLTSYEELLMGDPVINATTGQPVFVLRDGVPMLQRGPALVETSSGAANTAGIARKSRLTEILWGQTLKADAGSRTAHPNPPATAPDHSKLLNAAEKRLLAEWMDLGGQYYNDPFGNGSNVRSVAALDQPSFNANVAPILRKTCVGCHQPGGEGAADFRQNRYVLTGNANGDFGVTLSMISDTCNPANNRLLKLPSTVPHPAAAAATVPPQVNPVLPAGSADFNAIAAWIMQGCSGS